MIKWLINKMQSHNIKVLTINYVSESSKNYHDCYKSIKN